MSPRAYIICFPASVAIGTVDEMLRAAAELGAISVGTNDREHFVVIERSADLERFDRLTSDWQKSEMVVVRPL
ncbi:hypothetical protein [Sphingobium sp.]|jgi:hypothetical protein|uniref:hypothetical protein n=1 Tax=Sphingobium sp. TaxID=1912891 RepID=UPI000C4DB9A2|nr:hypothetical protein [Sphingobium sp.]MBS88504.1 hypothetical protein [Sphingobium sp.]MBU1795166.1 hypothetical protein [Alphaproteobacteria bacterium]